LTEFHGYFYLPRQYPLSLEGITSEIVVLVTLSGAELCSLLRIIHKKAERQAVQVTRWAFKYTVACTVVLLIVMLYTVV